MDIKVGIDAEQHDAIWAMQEKYGGHMGQHPDHTLRDWRDAVKHDDTRVGYWEWVLICLGGAS